MGIFSFLFANNKKLPFKKVIRFERKKTDFNINIGDQLKIWNKPNTSDVYLYAKGSVAGDGLVGTTTNSTISYHLNNTENLFIDNKIIRLTKNSIELSIYMYADKIKVQEIQQNAKAEWLKKINKKYNPKSSWSLCFYSEQKISKNDFIINTITKNQIDEFYEKKSETIWLTNKKGEKFDAENRIRSDDLIKTLRAVFSEHKLEVIKFKKDYNYYHIDIGIK